MYRCSGQKQGEDEWTDVLFKSRRMNAQMPWSVAGRDDWTDALVRSRRMNGQMSWSEAGG